MGILETLPPMKSSLARWLPLPLGFLILGAVGSLGLQKRIVAQEIPGEGRAHLRVPSPWARVFGSTVVLEGENGKRAGLFYGLNEAPLMLLPGLKPATVLCIYTFNVSDEVLVFDLNGRWHPHAPAHGEEYFDLMVPDTQIPFRKADLEELRYALATVRAMSESTYESVSVPTWDFGWLRWYADRKEIEEIVEDVLREQEEDLKPARCGCSNSHEMDSSPPSSGIE
jgi:hypothetical protein